MTYEMKQAYSEICAVLDNMPKEYVKKIPEKIIKMFQTEKLKDYKPNINKENPIDNNNLSKNTMIIIAILNYRYWCPNKKIKDELYKQYLFNDQKYQKEIEEKYSRENLFENRRDIEQKNTKEQSLEIIEYKESLFRKIIYKIKKILHIRK